MFILVSGHVVFGQPIPNKELEERIDGLFESYAQYDRFIGSVLISKDNAIVYQKSFGYADLERGRKNTEKSIFSIASLSKSFTAVGVMKLVEDGKISLETPLSTYFPNFMSGHAEQITIQHLLNNSSGIQANIGRADGAGNGVMPEVNKVTIDELLEMFKDSKFNFEPGTAYEYNNFGYLLLANIIEKVAGKPFANYMEEAVFKPAKMKNTAFASAKNLNHKSYPYFGLGMNEFKKFSNPFHPSWLMGAAAMNSTTVDLHKFMQALDGGKLLKPTTLGTLYSKTQDMGVNDMASGLGWIIDQKEGERWVYNSGLLPGYAAVMGSLPEQNMKIIILSNATSVNPVGDEFQGKASFVEEEITDKVVSILLGKKVELIPLPGKSNVSTTTKVYQFDNEHTVVLKNNGEKYYLETAGKDSWSIFTYSFSKDAQEKEDASKTALFFAKAWSSQQFEGLSDHGNEQMKAFLGSEEGQGQLKDMWANFVNNAGNFVSYNIYKIERNEVINVHVRFQFETTDIGMVISLNAAHKIQGMFMDDAVKTCHLTRVELLPVGGNEFFIDGHRNGGMQDITLIVSDTELILSDGSKKTSAKRVSGL